jgi:hypothetical protein
MSRTASVGTPAPPGMYSAWLRQTLACTAVLTLATALRGQTLTISPSQVYVLECQETFVAITGSNVAGTASTLVDFSGNGQVAEIAPNIATATELDVWIPMSVALADRCVLRHRQGHG